MFFATRSAILQYLREFLDARGYLEVETPMMQIDPRRRDRAALRHASQCARHGALSAHRAGAVPEAARRRRLRARLRDQSQLPQRGPVDAAQPRVHDARAVSGLCRLRRPDGPDRGAVPRPAQAQCSAARTVRYQGEEFDFGSAVRARRRRGCWSCASIRPRPAAAARRRRTCAGVAARLGIPVTDAVWSRASSSSRSSRRRPSTGCASRPS